MALHTTPRSPPILLSRNERTMPSWVAEQSDRVGPKPPPPPVSLSEEEVNVQPILPPKNKIQPEPDYEVIEFSQQQYSNAPVRPSSSGSSGVKTPDVKSKCTLCGCNNSWVTCDECPNQIFCVSCDDMFHKHPKRKHHIRKTFEQSKPPLPPKLSVGHGGQLPPVAPPRRHKRGVLTPLMQRKDQVHNNSFGLQGAYTAPSSPAPSLRNDCCWQETNLDNFKSGNFNIMNRPLPATPKSSPSQISEDQSSRSCTPRSLFDNIQRPPSVTLEKIKNKANATLDRMQLLQQRYRQQKERDRNLFNEQMPQTHASRNDQLNARGLSTSVFNLPQTPPPRKSSLHSNGWISRPPPLQQAQSMAQLNCVKCHHAQPPPGTWNPNPTMMPMAPCDPWSNQLHAQQNLNHSNLSLNVPPGYVIPHPSHQMYPPPVFMNQRGLMTNMYPAQAYMGSMGSMGSIMNPGIIGVPPVSSRAGSRRASPALSRKSVTLRRKQNPAYYNKEPTDDEDSDEEDRRSMISNRSGFSRYRQRRLSSASQYQYNHETEITHNRSHRQRVKERNVPLRQQQQQQQQSINNNYHQFNKITSSSNGGGRSLDSDFNSSVKSSRIYSDLDSEGSTTKALIQAKIEQKLKEEDERKRKNKAMTKNTTKKTTNTTKQTTGVQTTPIKAKSSSKQVAEDEKEDSAIQKETANETISQEHKANDTGNDNNENKIEAVGEEAESLLGPPPATPNYEWECEFCTFVNEANVKICSVCCKTPSKQPKKLEKNISPQRPTTSDKNGTLKSQTVSTTTIANKIGNNAQNSSEKMSRNDEKLINVDINEKQESLEDIWATLDENIQNTAHEVSHKIQNPLSGLDDSPQPPVRSISNSSVSTLHGKNLDEASTAFTGANMNLSKTNSLHFNDTIQAVQISSHNPKTSNAYYVDDYHTFEDEVLANIHNNTHLSCAHHVPRFQKTLKQYCSSIDLYTDDSLQQQSVITDSELFRQCENNRRQPSLNDLRLISKVSPLNSYASNSKADLIEMKNPLQNVSDLYKYTAEELNAAVKYCGPNVHPLQWLQEHWPKLITTVQSLATKYGQERIENTIGTISQMEARDALRLHTGNIWQAVTECIEQRQRKYREISSTGNFSREDIVTALTIHQGNVNLALRDLERSQLKPFLMRIWGSPGGVENESGITKKVVQENTTMQHSSVNISKDIHDFLSVHAPECMPIQSNKKNDAYTHSNQTNLTTSLVHHSPDNTAQYNGVSKEFIPSCLQIDETLLNNKYVLKDLETLIGNIEQQQQQQQEQQQQLKSSTDIPIKIENEYDPEVLRILTKSPIVMAKNKSAPLKITNNNNNSIIQSDDVKNFMWQHIQEIVPNLVEQVEKELLSESENISVKQLVPLPQMQAVPPVTPLAPGVPPPVDHDEFLMEEIIKPNLKNATIKEELPPLYKYAAEIETFRMAFDKALERDYERECEFDNLHGAKKQIFYLYEGHLKENTEQFPLNTETLNNVDLKNEERKVKLNPSEESLIFTIAEDEPSSSFNSNQKPIPNAISKTKSHSSIPINAGRKTPLFNRTSQSLTPEPLNLNKLEQATMEHSTLNQMRNFDRDLKQAIEPTSLTRDSTNINVKVKKLSKIPVRRTMKSNSLLNNSNDVQNLQTPTTMLTTQAKQVVNEPRQFTKKPEYTATEDDTTETETIDTLNSNEMMLMIQHVGSGNSLEDSSLLPATSTSTLHSLSSTSSDIKRGGNESASKQNLTDLVKDTQRIIQQMRDEINFNDIISSEESELYTDDYDTDEYDDDDDDDDVNDNGENEEEEAEDNENWIDGIEYNDENDPELAFTEHTNENVTQQQENENANQNQLNSLELNENADDSTKLNKINATEEVSEKAENSIARPSEYLVETVPESTIQPNNKITESTISIIDNPPNNNTKFEYEDSQPSSSKAARANLTKLQMQNSSFINQNNAELPENHKNLSEEQQQIINLSTPTKIVETNQTVKTTSTVKTQQSSKIPKPKDTKIKDQKIESKKNLNTRSKSFSAPPPTPVGINSVKTLRQELLKQTQKLTKRTTPPKQPPPPFVRKKSITDAITKLTKPNSSSLSEKPSNSKLFLSKIRSQPRLPKKKYHETCFSDDDYESSTTSEEERKRSESWEVRQRKLSVPVFRTYPSIQTETDDIKTEELIEKFIKEELVTNLAEAQIAVTLISMKFKQDVAIWAAKQCSDWDHAIALLQQECELCNGIYPLNEIVTMLKCIHKCCKDCAKNYFTVQITERSINDCNCPFCKLPELHQQNEHEDENLEYFSNLDIFLKSIVNAEVHELFQLKLRDRTLLKDPNFKWCVQCSSGFFARPKQKRLICPDCGSVTCAQCRKTWQKQHENITCEQFSEWLQSNDPDAQQLSVQQHLEKNGIDCPKCKFRYSLSRGGCMHFTCTQCKYEFCYGCARPFMMGAKCNISPYCAKLGLHAHHPRNCLFYLRDKLPIQLQILLRNNGVSYEEDSADALETDITKNSSSNTNSNTKISTRCPIPIQKETPSGLVDTICNNDVPDKHAGLCRNHYVEYLTSKVAKANIDPLPIFDLTDCVQELRRRGIALPERGPWDTDEIYKNMCAEVIKQNIPLDAV